MPPTRVQIPQAPDLSPSHHHDTSPSEPVAPPVRRNLFSAHLSRRPASGQSSQSQSNRSSQTDQQAQPESNPFAPQPHLQPTLTRMAINDIYDPTISPNHPLSPGTSAVLFPGNSIIAVHQGTGRPILPNLPTLPAKLHLDKDDDDDNDNNNEDLDDEEDAHNALLTSSTHSHHQDPYAHINTTSSDPLSDPDFASSLYANGVPSARSHAAAALLDEADAERRDRERIERVLAEMMARQRARAKGKDPARHNHHDDDHDDIAHAERQELMGLIVTSLRRNVALADDETWMFGDARTAAEAAAAGLGYE